MAGDLDNTEDVEVSEIVEAIKSHKPTVYETLMSRVNEDIHNRQAALTEYTWLNDLPLPESGVSMYFRGEYTQWVQIYSPLDKVVMLSVHTYMIEHGWKLTAEDIASTRVQRHYELKMGTVTYQLEIQYSSWMTGSTCKLVPIAKTSNTIIKDDIIYEVVCSSMPDEELLIQEDKNAGN